MYARSEIVYYLYIKKYNILFGGIYKAIAQTSQKHLLRSREAVYAKHNRPLSQPVLFGQVVSYRAIWTNAGGIGYSQNRQAKGTVSMGRFVY